MNSALSPKLFLSCSVFLLINLFFSVNAWGQNKLEWFFHGHSIVNQSGGIFIVNAQSTLSDESSILFGTVFNDSSELYFPHDTVLITYRTFIAKISKNGDLLFVRPFNKNVTDNTLEQMDNSAVSVVDADDNIYLGTIFNGTWLFDSLGLQTPNLVNCLSIVKIDKNGEMLRDSLLFYNEPPSYGFASMFFGDNNKLYLTKASNVDRELIELDTSLTNMTRRTINTNTRYHIFDRDHNGRFLACGGTSIGTVDIDPGPGTFILGSPNSYICLLDSNLNLVDKLIFYGNSVELYGGFAKNGDIYVFGNAFAYGSNLIIDPSHVDGIIPDDSYFVARFDDQFNLKWNKYTLNAQNLTFRIVPGYPFSMKNILTKDDGLIFFMSGITDAAHNNFNLPILNDTIYNSFYTVFRHFVTVDSTGNAKNMFNCNLTGSLFGWELKNDSDLFVSFMTPDPVDISINGIPKIIDPIWNESVYIKYNVKLSSNNINGTVIADLNSNYTTDTTDSHIPNHPVYIDSTQNFTLSDSKGRYYLYCDTGTISIKTPNVTNFNSSTPFTISIHVDSSQSVWPDNDFYFTPENYTIDLALFSNAQPSGSPGFPLRYLLIFKNKGTLTTDYYVKLKYNGSLLHFNNSSDQPDIITSDSLTWNLSTLKPFESGSISIDFDIDTLAQMSDTLFFTSRIQATGIVSPDIQPLDNFDTSFVTITTSFDPNNKVSNQPELIPIAALDSSLYFKYTINFQNTGNDTAYKIVVVDTLPENADLRTFEWIGSSHNGIPTFVDGHILVVTFSDIILPDSNSSEVNSHGFIAYRIRPFLNLLPGDQMKNSADIFFDYNKPVKTNSTVSTFVIPQNINEINSGTYKPFVYPNPSHSTVRIIAPLNKKIIHIEFSDLQGRIITSNAGKMNQNLEVDVSDFSDGVYFLTVYYDDKLQATVKVLVH